MDQALTIWRFCDGKRGHESQSAGLVAALARRVPTQCVDVAVRARLAGAGMASTLPKPALLVGAGHRTHGPMVRARRRTGARAVVLMRPSFVRHRFDLCVVPEHDGIPADDAVLLTRGVLNAMSPGAGPRAGGLIAIGGPSRHHDWLTAEVVAQVRRIVESGLAAAPHEHWTITNSRRTPAETWRALSALADADTVQVVDWRSQSQDWLGETLARTRDAWISEDSVSMVYEALSAGAAVGVLAVPRRGPGRVMRGIAGLIRDGLVTPFGLWHAGRTLRAADAPLAEADRVADWIVERWLTGV